MTQRLHPTKFDVRADWPPSIRLSDDAFESAALLLRDQAERWRGNHPRSVEDYLGVYPTLAHGTGLGLTLAANEFLIRALRKESPRLDEYLARFPQWAGQLADEIDYLQRRGGPAKFNDSQAAPTNAPSRVLAEPVRLRSMPQLPGYELLAELGSGGMAVVYHARQISLNREVALKVILAGALAGSADRLRMRREAESVARLRHPNVVQIHDIGEHNGCLYLCLEYLAGGSLDSRLAEHPLPPDDAAQLIESLASGVQAAHDAGIVHRDLKPANILLDRDDTPKVTDFGLAKQRDEKYHLTATGATPGTPSYMAPEQVMPEPEKIGPATDVYGLGSILYECLTGRPPFEAPTILETMRQVANDEVAPVRRLQAGVPRDLETICLKCLEKDPAQRYSSARDLAEELARFRKGEPIRARPVSAIEHACRWARRNPTFPLLLFILGMFTLAVVGLMAWSTYHAYQVAGHLRERELHLHGLRGTLRHLQEAQTRYAELAAATGDCRWEKNYQEVSAEAARLRLDAVRLAPDASADANLLPVAEIVSDREFHALKLVNSFQSAEAWQLLQGETYDRARNDYVAAIDHFANRVDHSADSELREVQIEGFWSLASATVVTVLIGISAVAFWLVYLRHDRHRVRSVKSPCHRPIRRREFT